MNLCVPQLGHRGQNVILGKVALLFHCVYLEVQTQVISCIGEGECFYLLNHSASPDQFCFYFFIFRLKTTSSVL